MLKEEKEISYKEYDAIMGDKSYKKILTIDGGGIKGVFPIAFLAEIEEKIEGSIYEYFDLIAGTSTGGIIALGLALGIPAKDILHFYQINGPQIFTNYIDTNSTIFKRNIINWLKKTFKMLDSTLHDNRKLEKALRAVFDDKKIGHCLTRAMIPSFDINSGKLNIFKTSHHGSLITDYKKSVVDAAMATSAAPGYLAAYEGSNHCIFIDGDLEQIIRRV